MRQAGFWKRTKVHDWAAALLLFFLVREWLLPLAALTDTAVLTPFYLVTAGVLLLDLLVSSRLLTMIAKVAGVFSLIYASYFVTPFFDTAWLYEIYERLMRDLPLVFQQNWLEMSPITRNLLFDLLLVAVVSLLSYLVLEQRQALWFVFMTEAYLATLDTFMPYEADGAIIRALIAGFLLLSATHFAAVEAAASASAKSRIAYWRTLVAPLMIICLTVGVAYAGPKKEPSWPDPVPFLTGKSGSLPGGISKVGYDNNDEQLGGPFVQDERLVFRAATTGKHYWRGDSKDVYTGRGWVKHQSSYEAIMEPTRHTWENMLFMGLETEQIKAQVRFEETQQYSTIFFPGQLKSLPALMPRRSIVVQDAQYQNLEVHEALREEQKLSDGVITTLPVAASGYQLVAEAPILSEKALVNAGQQYPDTIRQRYLQLPESLPPRVISLAEEVTRSADTPYEKVRAVERYLRYSGKYQYETEDVPVVQPGEDFVDQFLFESLRGYCDHFSTAMTVMLRAAGVPARWVKGFTQGIVVDADGEIKIVEVRNKDAHSWVEVFFPNYGWIPFEATASFTSPLRVRYDLVTSSEQQPVVPPAAETPDRDSDESRLHELDELAGDGSSSFRFTWSILLWLLIPLMVAGAVLWLYRRRLLVWWLQRRIDACGNERFAEKYGALLLLYERMVMPRKEGETLREYVKRLRVSGEVRQDLWFLTQLYERVLYGYKDLEEKWRQSADKIMERLVRHLKP
ncbi:MAG: transglutaminase domain-containing protein [Brevibacillus sp.]|nr:transglutaminase domain-containing protein [Brevibacillus sp.]